GWDHCADGLSQSISQPAARAPTLAHVAHYVNPSAPLRGRRERSDLHPPPSPAGLGEGHNFYFRGSSGMLGTSAPTSNPKSHLVIQAGGMSDLPDDTHWAVTAFAEAELGDLRRTTRLVELAHVLAQHPTAALPEACGDEARLQAAYRFFANEAIAPPDL